MCSPVSEVESTVILDSVSKSFGSVEAVQGLDLEVAVGTVYGLLGPNGSGKSTTMKMIMGLLTPDSGEIEVYGMSPQRDPRGVKRSFGYVPETPRLYEFLTGVEYLDFIGDVYGLDPAIKKERIHEFLDAFDLEGHENEMIGGYSHGMKQKIAIIAALLHRPRLLILDEPLGGLDPKSARIMKDLIHKLADDGVTTIFSTHILEIADAICDRILVLYRGKKLAEGTPVELRELSNMADSTLEEVFLKMTGTDDIREIVEAIAT
jgi:ABC-2 type transport system ATP-binding protein